MDKYRVYNTKRWKILRVNYLAEHPFCEWCQIAPAVEVDHKRPLAEGGQAYDKENLQALCHSCHSIKTATEDGSFGNKRKKGKARAKGCTVDGLPLDSSSEWREYYASKGQEV